jgi:imidazolonepropionase-like amidohydrolase
MSRILFTNVKVLDCTGADPYLGEVLVEDNRIAAIAQGQGSWSGDRLEIIDGGGATLMPGLVESHAHLSLHNTKDIVNLGLIPPEEHTLLTMHNARLYLDHGITSCISAGAAKPRLDIVIRNAINAGEIPGPRLLAASPWLTVTGGLGDKRTLHIPHVETMAMMVDGPDEYRRVSRELIREGVDTIKLVVSGESYVPHAGPETTPMSEAEVSAAVEVARAHGKRVSAHAKSAESVKRCLRHGVKIIYHANFIDEEAMDLLETHKDWVFVSPNIAFAAVGSYEVSHLYTEEQIVASGVREELESAIRVIPELKKRGVRILGGGDYGFSLIPHGNNARDIEHFVHYLGFKPMEAILTMTKYGGEAMDLPDKIGQIQPGFLADLLLVNGDPLENPKILIDTDKLLAIVKDGQFHKRPRVELI